MILGLNALIAIQVMNPGLEFRAFLSRHFELQTSMILGLKLVGIQGILIQAFSPTLNTRMNARRSACTPDGGLGLSG